MYSYSKNFYIIAITETWLLNNISQMKYFPFFYRYRDSRGGGVLLAFKSSLTTMQLPSPSDLEIVSAEIDPNLLLCLIYHPPNSTEQLNSSLITNSLDHIKNIVIMGDLNFPGTFTVVVPLQLMSLQK